MREYVCRGAVSLQRDEGVVLLSWNKYLVSSWIHWPVVLSVVMLTRRHSNPRSCRLLESVTGHPLLCGSVLVEARVSFLEHTVVEGSMGARAVLNVVSLPLVTIPLGFIA